MFEYLLLACMVTGLKENTKAYCQTHSQNDYISLPACQEGGNAKRAQLYLMHYEKYGIKGPTLVIDFVCSEKTI
tara:strand:+ start:2889 stop:3110 length:222 start_codon:yes stop_codon:yes gene_type:complete